VVTILQVELFYDLFGYRSTPPASSDRDTCFCYVLNAIQFDLHEHLTICIDVKSTFFGLNQIYVRQNQSQAVLVCTHLAVPPGGNCIDTEMQALRSSLRYIAPHRELPLLPDCVMNVSSFAEGGSYSAFGLPCLSMASASSTEVSRDQGVLFLTDCMFVSDLHGAVRKYNLLMAAIEAGRPSAVFIGGDILPSAVLQGSPARPSRGLFISGFLTTGLTRLQSSMGSAYPRVFLILGNDDPKAEEDAVLSGEEQGLWEYIHHRKATLHEYTVYGYSYVPPTPFMLKDWERYDVSRYVDPGCVSPRHGYRSTSVSDYEVEFSTIASDLDQLVREDDLSKTIMLFHAPPYDSRLDRAALDGKMIDHVPLDVHVGSIAISRFIQARQPLLTLHGHIHESARLSGSWRDKRGDTFMFSAAHDGPELALVRFRLENLASARRDLLSDEPGPTN
jgi:Icc-related predicted phosphoesterase